MQVRQMLVRESKIIPVSEVFDGIYSLVKSRHGMFVRINVAKEARESIETLAFGSKFIIFLYKNESFKIDFDLNWTAHWIVEIDRKYGWIYVSAFNDEKDGTDKPLWTADLS